MHSTLGSFVPLAMFENEEKKLGNPGDTYRHENAKGAILVLNL